MNSKSTRVPSPILERAFTGAMALQDILVVEDQEQVRNASCELLTLLGYRVESAVSAEQALVTMAQKTYDVLLTDVMLPGMNGVQLAEKMHSIAPGTKVIFMTGFGYLFPELFQQTTAKVLEKPYDLEALYAALAS